MRCSEISERLFFYLTTLVCHPLLCFIPPIMNEKQTYTEDLRIGELKRLITPEALKEKLPLSAALAEQIVAQRQAVKDIIQRKADRLLVVIGPCSIHDPAAALDYAKRLKAVSDQVADDYLIVMRVYFEKPRTTTGRKGYIIDPHLDDSCDMSYGLEAARELLLQIASLGLPIATEFLDPIVPQYTADLISWAAIGARTTESQTHREMASGLSMPVGFKNGTDGNVQVAINAIGSASIAHSFLGIDPQGHTSVVTTKGNEHTHLVLRGGDGKPNYDAASVSAAATQLENAGFIPALMVDCSHANADKIAANQLVVWESILEQRANGNSPIIGAMIESFIEADNEKIAGERSYGLSITDPCIDWPTTERMLLG